MFMNKVKYTALIFNAYCPQKCEITRRGSFMALRMYAAFDIYLHFLKTFLVAKHYSDMYIISSTYNNKYFQI